MDMGEDLCPQTAWLLAQCSSDSGYAEQIPPLPTAPSRATVAICFIEGGH